MRNKIAVFNEFDSKDFKAYLNRLLLQRLAGILAGKGELTLEDLENAYEQWRVLVRILRSLRKKSVFFSIDHNVYAQLRDFVISFDVSILSDDRFEN